MDDHAKKAAEGAKFHARKAAEAAKAQEEAAAKAIADAVAARELEELIAQNRLRDEAIRRAQASKSQITDARQGRRPVSRNHK